MVGGVTPAQNTRIINMVAQPHTAVRNVFSTPVWTGHRQHMIVSGSAASVFVSSRSHAGHNQGPRVEGRFRPHIMKLEMGVDGTPSALSDSSIAALAACAWNAWMRDGRLTRRNSAVSVSVCIIPHDEPKR